MSKNCPIMQRMKENYEKRSRTFLTRRVPVIMRLDGKAFHTYTKGLVKPFDEGLIEDMQKTAIYLCQNIQGAKCAYTQSDEISILITDYEKLTTEAWYNYNVQKMTSVSAAFATAKFNQLRLVREADYFATPKSEIAEFTLAFFDSRVCTVPQADINNYFLARQRDAEKNSIAMLAQSLYSHKELHLKNGSDMQEMCWEKGHNWNDLHFSKKRGSLIVKNTYVNGERVYLDNESNTYQLYGVDGYLLDMEWLRKKKDDVVRNKWEVIETPIFSQSSVIKDLV